MCVCSNNNNNHNNNYEASVQQIYFKVEVDAVSRSVDATVGKLVDVFSEFPTLEYSKALDASKNRRIIQQEKTKSLLF